MSFQSDILSKEDANFLLEHVNIDDPVFYNLPDEISYDVVDGFQEQKFSELLHDKQDVAWNGNYQQNFPDYYAEDLPKEGELNKFEDQKLNMQGEFQGPHDFEVVIVSTGSKNPWEYSAHLNKIYTDRKSPVPIDFIVKNRNSPNTPLFIRVMPMFNSPQFAQDCVYRCPNHEFNGVPNELNHEKCHIVKCHNKNTKYFGDRAKGDRLSFLIPLATHEERLREIFEFYCLNSCPVPGINRRSVEIIFTLEDIEGNALGRKNLNVRICSCPRRDREKDESIPAANGKKRGKIAKKTVKKVSISMNKDVQELTIPVLGPQMRNHVLKYLHDLYAGEIVRCGDDVEKQQPYLQGLEKVKAILAKFNDNASF